jgi:hypothetical protein
MSSLIHLTPDLHIEARLKEMAARAGEDFAAHQKSADATPKDNAQRCFFQIQANNAKLDENELHLLAHAIGAGHSISVPPSIYERIYP